MASLAYLFHKEMISSLKGGVGDVTQKIPSNGIFKFNCMVILEYGKDSYIIGDDTDVVVTYVGGWC